MEIGLRKLKNLKKTKVLVSFQTGKGTDHLLPVFYTPETIKRMPFLTDKSNRLVPGVAVNNQYVFASIRGRAEHVIGWHYTNDILFGLLLKGKINATKNRHRVTSILAKLELSEKERDLVFKHFGHSMSLKLLEDDNNESREGR